MKPGLSEEEEEEEKKNTFAWQLNFWIIIFFILHILILNL